MDQNDREVKEGLQYQGVDERIAYGIDTEPWGGSPSGVTVVVKDESDDNTDVTTTVMPSGSASVSGDDITLPLLRALTEGRTYRVEVKFTIGASLFEAFFRVKAQL